MIYLNLTLNRKENKIVTKEISSLTRELNDREAETDLLSTSITDNPRLLINLSQIDDTEDGEINENFEVN